MIIVISDVHLGDEKCNRESFQRFVSFLAKQEIEHLVLLGDVLDFWRRSANRVVQENREILDALAGLDAEKHYVVGNHDYALLFAQPFPFEFTKSLTLNSGHCKFRFIHGYQIEFCNVLRFYEGICEVLCTSGDRTGHIMSNVWDFYEQKMRRILTREGYSECWKNLERKDLDAIVEYIMKYPEEEPLRREFTEEQIAHYRESTRLNPDEILVYGHSHNPSVKENEANAGSWVSGSCSNSFLTIVDEKVTLNFWKQKEVLHEVL